MLFKIIHDIKIPCPNSYSDCKLLNQSDYFRYKGIENGTWLGMLCYSFFSPIFRFNFWLRLCSYKPSCIFFSGYFIAKFFKTIYGRRRCLMIDERMPIGYGLYISHGFGVVVNPSAVIGNNVVLSQFTTIGANQGKAAVIGDNVFIGPSVCLVENVFIGNGAVIGAGAVVVNDVLPSTTVAGVPATVISHNNSKDYILNPYICDYKS